MIRTTYPNRISYHPGVWWSQVSCASPWWSLDRGACRHSTRMSHLEFYCAAIPPGCLASGILLRHHSIRIFCIRLLTPDGRGKRFNFLGQIYPDPLIALTRRVSQSILHFSMPRCSPKASRYGWPTFWDIFL